MKKFLKENWSKLIILIVAVASIFSYVAIYCFNYEKEGYELERNQSGINMETYLEHSKFAEKILGQRMFAYMDLGQWNNALREVERIISINKDNRDAWTERGVILYKLNQCILATASLYHAMILGPNDKVAGDLFSDIMNKCKDGKIKNPYCEGFEPENQHQYNFWSWNCVPDLKKYEDK